MVEFNILSGKMAGVVWIARHFPVRIGRSPLADFRTEDEGVWDQHLELAFDRAEGFALTVQSGALTSVNGETVQRTILRNADLIECGSLQMQFWLPRARQNSLRSRE